MTTTTSPGVVSAESSEGTAGLKLSGLQLRLISIVGFFLAWEISGHVPISPAFPTFSGTMMAMFEMIFDGSLFLAYFETLKPLLLGVGISAFFGVTIGVSMGLNKKSRWLWEPIFVVLQASPVAALIPLITYAYGIGITAKTVAVIILASPIIVLNTYKAVGNASPVLVQMSRAFQGTRMQEIWKVIIPNASAGYLCGASSGRRGRFHRRYPGGTVDYADGYWRHHFLQPLNREIPAHVCGGSFDHRFLGGDGWNAGKGRSEILPS